MYAIKHARNTLSILYNGRTIIKDLSPVVSLDDGTEFCIDTFECENKNEDGGFGEYGKLIFRHVDEENETTFSLVAEYNDSFVKFGVRLDSKSNFDGKSKCVRPVGGICLKVEDIGDVAGLMANYLNDDWWTRPWFDQNISNLPARTQSLLWKDNTCYHYLLPLCSEIFKTDLCGSDAGMNINISAYAGGYSNFYTSVFVLSSSDSPFEAVKIAMSAGMEQPESVSLPRESRRYPDILEYLGWCSWNAFYHDVNAKGLVEKADEFIKSGLPVKWFIIDDGWSEISEQRSLNSFDAESEKFPEGLGAVVRELKEGFGIRWIGVWHTIIGYWNGINKNSTIANELRECFYTTHSGKYVPSLDYARAFVFWDRWHSYLKKQGIDFVKVDYQSVLVNIFKNNIAIGKAARSVHRALEASIGINFDHTVINCMGMASENIWSRPISSVSRNSGDFLPTVDDSFKEHALQNAYNSFYHSQFFWGDWDMWWSNHEQSVNNAVLRAVSGGPVYVSDPVGMTVKDIIMPLILSDGRILRCDNPGIPTEDCLTVNPCEENSILKIWNRTGASGIIAAFNINKAGSVCTGRISPSDIPMLPGNEFAVFEHFGRKVCVMGNRDSIDISLDNNATELYVVVPIEAGYAFIGCINKYISPAVIDHVMIMEDTGAVVLLKEGGLFAFTSDKPVRRVLINKCEREFVSKENGLYLVECSDCDKNTLIEIYR